MLNIFNWEMVIIEIIKKMLNFDTMITPTIIKLIYTITTIIGIIFGLIAMLSGITSRYGGGSKVVLGLVIIALAPFINRVLCESLIVIFKINENIAKLIEQTEE